MKTAEAKAVSSMASPTFILPWGSSQFFVRGFNASNFRSASRLKAIAAVRAPIIATKIQTRLRSVIGYRGDARASDANANGNANTVWENRTRLA